MQVSNYKNIIFDLGGVIINLSEENTLGQFAKLSERKEEIQKIKTLSSEEYKAYEKGLLSDEDFRDAVRSQLYLNASDNEIDFAFNAMLLDIPVARINLLKSLRNKHQLFLLSNTNTIHLRRFNEIMQETTGDSSIDPYFVKAYYSHQVNLRKPDKEIFELVLNENNLNPAETLFLDDNLSNLEGAQLTGIHTFHVQDPAQLFELFV